MRSLAIHTYFATYEQTKRDIEIDEENTARVRSEQLEEGDESLEREGASQAQWKTISEQGNRRPSSSLLMLPETTIISL